MGAPCERAVCCLHAELHYIDGSPLTLQYLLAVDTINFCFWPQPGLEYEHLARGLKVPFLSALCCSCSPDDGHCFSTHPAQAVVSRGCLHAEQEAVEKDRHALDAEQLACMTGPRLQALLARAQPLPEQEQRAALLREACCPRFACSAAKARMPS